MAIDSNLTLLVAIWMATAGIILYRFWKRKMVGAGLVLAYLLVLGLIHWLGAAVYLLPWYSNPDISVVEAGFLQSTYAVIAFAIGVLILAPVAMRVFQFPPSVTTSREPNPRLAKMYIVVGVVSYLVLLPLFGRLPTITALVAAGWSLVVVGLALACWRAWQVGRRRAFAGWLIAALSLPFFTIVTQGFLGYGMIAFLVVFAFIACFVGPRRKLIVGTPILTYLSLSLYVTYMGERVGIRALAWGGAPITARIAHLYHTLSNLEWFNPYNIVHLQRIDDRLNQNYLVGAAMDYLTRGYQNFAYGDTLWQALIALVPRALWPDKPVVAGSMGLVTEYTGIHFAPGTSVGIGQVMELHINFGTVGVIFGFLIIGIIVRILDTAAGERLLKGDWQGFALWFLPGIAFLNVGGSLVEVTSSAGAAVVTALLVNNCLLPHLRGRELSPMERNSMEKGREK